MPTKASVAKPKPKTKAKAAPAARWTLAETMKALEAAGSAQAKKTYARHGAKEPMFGVSFATLGTLVKRIRVDHDLALALWDTGNFDAQNLAYKIADPAVMKASDLDRWAKGVSARMCASYISMLAAEGPDGFATAKRWLASKDENLRGAGWGLVAQLVSRGESVPDAWFEERLGEIEKTIHAAPNEHREPMNYSVIWIGGRSPALKKAALATAKRIGKVEVDHGDTSCETPDAVPYIEKMWARSKEKGFASPAAQERDRESPRTRC